MTAIHLADAASRILMGQQGWTIVICGSSRINELATEFFDELSFLADDEPGVSIQLFDMNEDGRAFVDKLTTLPLPSTCIVQATETNLLQAVKFLEASRGRLIAGPAVVLITDEAGARTVAANAPNLWSWVGSRVWTNVDGTATADIQARLASLREATGQSDDEVVDLAVKGKLNTDPLYAEWLALLGRGDLLGN